LFKNKQTPRIYVPDKPLDEKSFENILAHLLLCDIDNLIEDTNKYLTKLGTSTKALLSLNNADKEDLVELIEDLLLNGWGQGKILYDHLRVVPNEDCELLNFIDSQPLSTGDKYHKILNTLKKINQTHVNINLHPNNWSGFKIINGIPIPDVVELTFVRRDLFDTLSDQKAGNVKHYEVNQLNTPNNPNSPEYRLCFFSQD